MHAGVMQNRQGLEHLIGRIEHYALGNFDADLAGFQVVALQYRQIYIQYAAVDKILARKIDIDASGIVSLVLPVAKNAAGLVEYPVADFDDLPGSFGNPDKVSWIDIFTVLLWPAD